MNYFKTGKFRITFTKIKQILKVKPKNLLTSPYERKIVERESLTTTQKKIKEMPIKQIKTIIRSSLSVK